MQYYIVILHFYYHLLSFIIIQLVKNDYFLPVISITPINTKNRIKGIKKRNHETLEYPAWHK